MTSASPAVSSPERHAEPAGRQIPWSNEAEQAVLGAMLLDQDAALKAAEILDDSMFYREGHRLLFRAMQALTERGDVIDPVTLRDELQRRGDLDRAGGMEYVASLIDVVPTAANLDYHARIVRTRPSCAAWSRPRPRSSRTSTTPGAPPGKCSTTPSTAFSRWPSSAAPRSSSASRS